MLKYRFDAYIELKDETHKAPYNGICHAGFTIVDLIKSFPVDGLDIGDCSDDFGVEEAVTKLKEYFNPDDVVIYADLNWIRCNTTLPRALFKHVYPVQSLNNRYYFTQDDPNKIFYCQPDYYVKFKTSDGSYKSESFKNYKPRFSRDNLGNVSIAFFASDNANSEDGSVPIDLNIFYIEIKWNDSSKTYKVTQTTMDKGAYGCPGIFALVENFKQSEPFIPAIPKDGTYCVLDNITSPLWTAVPDWTLKNELPAEGQYKPIYSIENYGYFEIQKNRGTCLSCNNSKISVNNDKMLYSGPHQEYQSYIDEYLKILENCIEGTPNKLSHVEAWSITNNTETITSELNVKPVTEGVTGGADAKLSFTNYDNRPFDSFSPAYSVQPNQNYGRNPSYTGFLVFKDLEADGTFTEFSSVYVALFMHRNTNDGFEKLYPYGIVYYHNRGNGLEYWIPSPELKTLFIGKKFTVVGEIPEPPGGENPFGPGDNKPIFPGDGETGQGGGGGPHGSGSDSITLPEFPSPENQIVSAGWSHAWAPTKAERDGLSSYLFSDGFINNFKKQYANPMDVVLKSHVMPLDPMKGGALPLKIAGIDTGVSLTSLGNQYREYNIGSVFIPTYWNSFLDFDPYTSIEIFLPFIGTYKLNTYDVINKTISVKYRMDFYTGNCLAIILADGSPLYFFNANVSYEVPFASSIKNGQLTGIISAISGASGLAAGVATGNPLAIGGGLMGMASGVASMFKTDITHAGSISGDVGYMAPNYFYVRITRPVTAIPKNFGREKGYTSNITRQLGSLKGYTKVKDVHVQGINAPKEILSEIESLLKGGVLL